MQVYLVGGAVRDKLLGLPVREKDWVIVGAQPEELIKQGYTQVGKDFPVFLHPETKDEYALARTERKLAPGYQGFSFHAAPDVSLEEDLLRRDLTINAIAQDSEGNLIDPYHGKQDIEAQLLRHVSPAFVEDPVRLLRIARFAAKLPDFRVAEETLTLLKTIVSNGEVDALVAERVWQEFQKALNEQAPWRFFEVLQDCDAIAPIFPHFIFSEAASANLKAACALSDKAIVRFASLFITLNNSVESLKHIKAPKDFLQLASLLNEQKVFLTGFDQKSPEAIIQLFKVTDAYRRPQRFEEFLLAAKAFLQTQNTPLDIKHLLSCLYITGKVSARELLKEYQGPAIAEALYQKRLALLNTLTQEID